MQYKNIDTECNLGFLQNQLILLFCLEKGLMLKLKPSTLIISIIPH